MKKLKSLFSRFYLVLVLAFFYLPILYVIVFSFNDSKSLSKFTGFSLQWYEKMFANRTIMESIYYTVVIAVIATVVSTIVGTIAAIGLSKSKRIVKELTLQINNLPMMNPEIVTAIGLMLLFTSLNIKTGFMTLLLAHIAFCIPYVMLSIMPKLRQMDISVFEAAQDLGCSPSQAFFKVVIPEIMPGIVAGFLMSFTYSLDDFIISYFVTGPTSQTLPITIYSMTRRKVSPEINALSTIIFVVVLTVLLLVNVGDARRERELRMKARDRV